MNVDQTPAGLCPNCRQILTTSMARTAIWRGDDVALVEDIPALVCSSCSEQFYDDDVSDALRKLNENGFPKSESTRTIEVPVFSLKDRVRRRKNLPEDTYVD
jgi:YgiT-type zinc finger domain-containing protein